MIDYLQKAEEALLKATEDPDAEHAKFWIDVAQKWTALHEAKLKAIPSIPPSTTPRLPNPIQHFNYGLYL